MSAAGTPGAISTQAQQQAMFGTSTTGGNPATASGGQSVGTPAPTVQVSPSPHRGLATAIKETIDGGRTKDMVTGLTAQLEVFKASTHDATKAATIVETLNENQIELSVFAAMGDGTKLRCIWGIGKVYDPSEVMDVTGGITAFMGDRDKRGNPPPMVGLQPRGYVVWMKVKTNFDEDAFEAYYADEANHNTLIGASTGPGASTLWLPRLLYLPGKLGVFAAKKPRAPVELLKEAKRLAADPSSGVTEQLVELVKKWCIGAATKDDNHPRSVLYLTTTPVTSDADEFVDFKQRKCDAILGPAQVPTAQPVDDQARFQAQVQVMASTLVATLVPTLNQLNNNNSGGQTQRSGGLDASVLTKGKELEAAEKIQICGWSGVPSFVDASPVWRELAATTSLTTRRHIVHKLLKEFERDLGLPVNHTTFFPEKFFTEVLGLKVNCDEAVATYRNLGRGFSAQNCLAATLAYIAEQTDLETAQAESKNQRTYDESLRIGKAAAVQRLPPGEFESFKLATATYAALLRGFFTPCSPLYKDVLAIRQAMELPQVAQKQEFYTPAVLYPHWYAILTYSRAFFSVKVDADDLQAQPPRYPSSMLSAVIPALINAKAWEDATFPMQWKSLLLQPPMPPSGGAWSRGPPNHHKRGGGHGNEQQSSTGGPLDHCHPIIRKEFKVYHDTFGGVVKLVQLCDASNASINDLPYLNAYGRDNMCYSYIMGLCQGKNCERPHVEKDKLPPDFVNELCAKTKAGREYLIRKAKQNSGEVEQRKRQFGKRR